MKRVLYGLFLLAALSSGRLPAQGEVGSGSLGAREGDFTRINSNVGTPTDCLFYPLVAKGEFPTAVSLVEAWVRIYRYLDGPEYRAHRDSLGKTWGEEPIFILTSVEIRPSQFNPVAARARQAGLPEPLLEQANLCLAIRAGNVEGIKDWLPRVRARAEMNSGQPYQKADALLPTAEMALALAQFGGEALEMEMNRKGVLAEIMEKPRMLAESDSVFRDLTAIDAVLIRMQEDGKRKAGEKVPTKEWQAALPNEAGYQRLRRTGMNVLGHTYGDQVLGERPALPKETYGYFERIFGASAWSPFRIPGQATTVVVDPALPNTLQDSKRKLNVISSTDWSPVPQEKEASEPAPAPEPKVVSGTRVNPAPAPAPVPPAETVGEATEAPLPAATPRKSAIPAPAIRKLPIDEEPVP
jgi:hypothetical protein